MKTTLRWTEGMAFVASNGEKEIITDAKPPIGRGTGLTPKELVVAGLAGCTAVDVVAWLKKHKQAYTKIDVDTEVGTTTGVYPAVFTDAMLNFSVEGQVDKDILLEGIRLSQTKYCGVSAMLSKAFPIRYQVILNGEKVGEGQAAF